MIIRETEKPKLKDLIVGIGPKAKTRGDVDVLKEVNIVGSGKGAMAIILEYLKNKKIITNKLDEVIMPDWLGSWVYSQVEPYAFPAKKYSKRSKAIFVYHQYGFPQNLEKIMNFAKEKNLIVIEDCAHALASEYCGRPLGSFGDFALYSFSKWFFCFALGGVKSKFDDFRSYASEAVSKTPIGLTLIKDTAKFLYECSIFSNSNIFQKYANFLLGMSYALYGNALKPSCLAKNLLKIKIKNEIEIRQKRYLYFWEQTKNLGICDHLEKEGITPYVIPIRCPESKSDALVGALKEKGITTGIYRFDINRNLLAPQFVPVVWIPCHGGISDNEFEAITSLVLKTL